MQLYIIHVPRDDLLIETLESDGKVFLAEVAELETRLKVVASKKEADDDK